MRRLTTIIRNVLLGLFCLFMLVAALVLSPAPFPQADELNAAKANEARRLLERIQAQLGRSPPQLISARSEEVEAGLLLAGRAAGAQHISVTHEENLIQFQGSAQMPFGFWINAQVKLTAAADGSPVFDARAGRLPLPDYLVRLLYSAFRARREARGVNLPEIDDVLKEIVFNENGVVLTSDLDKGLAAWRAFGGGQIDEALNTAAVAQFCRLTASRKRNPTNSMTVMVNRAFADDAARKNPEATLIALAMLTRSARIALLAGISDQTDPDCKSPPLRH